MSSYASNAVGKNFLDKKSLEQDADEKTLANRLADRLNNYHTFLSHKAGRAGENTTGAGRMLRGVTNRNNSDEDAFFFGRNLEFALMVMAQPLIQYWDSAKNFLKNAYSNLAGSTALPPSHAPISYDRDSGPLETQHVSDAFLAVVNEYQAEQIEIAEISAESAFNAIDNGFKIPLRAHITKAYNDAHGHEDIAKHNLKTVILEQNGICFSTEHDKHIICATKLNVLREAFRENPETKHLNDLGSNPISVFKQATQVTTPNLPQQPEVALKALQPALVTA